MKPRNWAIAASISFLAMMLVYGYGASRMFSLDMRKECTYFLHQDYDPKYASAGEQFFPLSKKCNASYNMVPSFVNPSVVLFLGVTSLCAGAAVVAAVRRRRAVPLRVN
ncbi:hypothetical protein ACFZCV_18330 [Streptomyces sp. NPDC007920]|uniref:hypothetical protein n=1 Tax=Streptomyces sp. NPDC007920 TaxID=3364794 RepID=UPI0036EED1B4